MYNTADKVSRIFPVGVNGVKCKSCKNIVPDGSVFCNHCGEKLVRTRREKQKEISVPKAKQLPSGTWFIEMQIEGERYPVSAKTEAECVTKARALKTGLIEQKKKASAFPTLGEAIDKHIEALRERNLESTSLNGYTTIRSTRFTDYMDTRIDQIEWDEMVSKELENFSIKTVKNAWSLVGASVERAGLPRPKIERISKKTPKKERQWLDYKQIEIFLSLIRGQKYEIDALLALHSLRKSEVFGLRWESVDLEKRRFTVLNTIVIGEGNRLVERTYGKTEAAYRTLPIMIPRLFELLAAMPKPEDGTGYVVPYTYNAMYKQNKRICEANGLPNPGVHGLRHSFASLGYHLKLTELQVQELGGWKDARVVRNIYTHLAKQDRLDAENAMSKFYEDIDGRGRYQNENPNEEKNT